MKYLKTYEQSIDEPKVGDYVICDDEFFPEDYGLRVFIKNNIGQINGISTLPGGYRTIGLSKYNVLYDDIPLSSIRIHFQTNYGTSTRKPAWPSGNRIFNRKDIIYWSDNKEDCETYLISNKYNL